MAGAKRHYKQGGLLFWQKEYLRGRKKVKGHFKTKPDDNPNNNRKGLLGY